MSEPVNELDAYVEDLKNDVRRAYEALQAKDRLTGCTSFVQRKLGIGYCRASVIMTMLEDAGQITKPGDDGVRAWTV